MISPGRIGSHGHGQGVNSMYGSQHSSLNSGQPWQSMNGVAQQGMRPSSPTGSGMSMNNGMGAGRPGSPASSMRIMPNGTEVPSTSPASNTSTRSNGIASSMQWVGNNIAAEASRVSPQGLASQGLQSIAQSRAQATTVDNALAALPKQSQSQSQNHINSSPTLSTRSLQSQQRKKASPSSPTMSQRGMISNTSKGQYPSPPPGGATDEYQLSVPKYSARVQRSRLEESGNVSLTGIDESKMSNGDWPSTPEQIMRSDDFKAQRNGRIRPRSRSPSPNSSSADLGKPWVPGGTRWSSFVEQERHTGGKLPGSHSSGRMITPRRVEQCARDLYEDAFARQQRLLEMKEHLKSKQQKEEDKFKKDFESNMRGWQRTYTLKDTRTHEQREQEVVRRKIEKVEKMKEDISRQREEQEMKECTFRPTLVSKTRGAREDEGRLKIRGGTRQMPSGRTLTKKERLKRLLDQQQDAQQTLTLLDQEQKDLQQRLKERWRELNEEFQNEETRRVVEWLREGDGAEYLQARVAQLSSEGGAAVEAAQRQIVDELVEQSKDEVRRKVVEAWAPEEQASRVQFYGRWLEVVHELENIEAKALPLQAALTEADGYSEEQGPILGVAEQARRSLPSADGVLGWDPERPIVSTEPGSPSVRSAATPPSTTRSTRSVSRNASETAMEGPPLSQAVISPDSVPSLPSHTSPSVSPQNTARVMAAVSELSTTVNNAKFNLHLNVASGSHGSLPFSVSGGSLTSEELREALTPDIASSLRVAQNGPDSAKGDSSPVPASPGQAISPRLGAGGIVLSRTGSVATTGSVKLNSNPASPPGSVASHSREPSATISPCAMTPVSPRQMHSPYASSGVPTPPQQQRPLTIGTNVNSQQSGVIGGPGVMSPGSVTRSMGGQAMGGYPGSYVATQMPGRGQRQMLQPSMGSTYMRR